MQAGLIAGAVAAIVAVVVQLPLESPSDAFLNSASVVIGTLLLGLIAGAVWRAVERNPRNLGYFATVLVAGFLVVSVGVLAANTQVERMASFTLPLAAIAFVIVGVLTVVLAKVSLPKMWPSVAAVVVALALGIGLAGQGDQESGDLFLPPRAATVAPPAQAPAPEAPSASASTNDGGTQSQDDATQPADAASSEDVLVYKIVDGSEATFTVTEQLSRLPLPNDAVVRTSALSGEVRLDGGPSAIEIDMLQMSSDQRFRDSYIRRTFRFDPTATYTVDDAGAIPDGLFDGDTVTTQVNGTLTIRGWDAPITFEIEARHDGDILHLVGRGSFTWDDINMTPPVAGSVVWVEDEVSVQILLELEPQADS